MYVTAKKAGKYFSVNEETLRLWAEHGKIEHTKTLGGHRRYKLPAETDQVEKGRYVYARVSSKKQESDLQRQVKFLKQRYPSYEVIEDIGSGLNFKRQGFRRILELLFAGDIKEVVVASSDRFSRFGTREFFVWLFEHFKAKLVIIENKQYTNPNVELSEDLLEIITVFTAKYHGRRKYEADNKEN
jgi:predicted site-specific integrase-resolvase